MTVFLVEDVSQSFKNLSPYEIFEKIADEEYSFFLDSGCDPKKLGRYSIMGANPYSVLRSRGEEIDYVSGGKVERIESDPLKFLEEKLFEAKADFESNLPFVCGAVGYFSYDLCRQTEGINLTGIEDHKMYNLEFGFYDVSLVCDNIEGKKYVSAQGTSEEECKGKIKKFSDKLITNKRKNIASQEKNVKDIESNFTKSEYFKAVEKIRDYIRAGDTYQVNLAQRFQTEYDGDAWTLYKNLRKLSPAPFSAYLNFGETKILSSSPERFLKIRGGIIETRPIKGTRPRGETPKEDKRLAQELTASEKDKAEHIMIVDLERNDLGKVCQFGSVRVAEMEVTESYANVHHMVSTVRGRLREGVSVVDCIRATFPGGSITGAPKVRAMEIIDELEPTRRGLYTGSIGYIGFDGSCDLNIVIRTMIVKDGKIFFHVGGGVVYDSTPEGEYQETMDKGEALFDSLN
ncbi:MAG: aminodeoxychorismate synthase, component I [Methanobacteriota archaeon]